MLDHSHFTRDYVHVFNLQSASFQVVLLTDGLHSYILYKYGVMNITSEGDSRYVAIGYSDGKDNRMDFFFNSTLEDRLHPENSSNVGKCGITWGATGTQICPM